MSTGAGSHHTDAIRVNAIFLGMGAYIAYGTLGILQGSFPRVDEFGLIGQTMEQHKSGDANAVEPFGQRYATHLVGLLDIPATRNEDDRRLRTFFDDRTIGIDAGHATTPDALPRNGVLWKRIALQTGIGLLTRRP